MVGTDRVFWGRRSKTLACHQYGNYGVSAGRRERGKRRRLNILVRNLSWNDRKQSYCWKRERGMTRVGWNPTHFVWGGWAGLDCCSGAAVTRCLTNTAALTGPTAALTLLLYWLIPLSVLMCRHTCVNVCCSDFHWLTVHSMALVCVFKGGG